VPVVELRASIILGSGSLSFELIRALVERLPVMLCPRWVQSPAQPIAIEDVIAYLLAALDVPVDEGRIFEGATSNVFLSRGDGLLTPPAEGAILPGVLRAKLEQLAAAAGIPVTEGWARVADLRPDDGMLLTSSVRGVVAVETVDGVRLRTAGSLAKRLRALVDEAEAASTAAFRAAYL